MAALAIIFFTTALIQESYEPTVHWIFSSDACDGCSREQMTLMQQYFQEGDQITLFNAPDYERQMVHLRKRLKKGFPGTPVTIAKIPYRQIKTGWIFLDPATKQEITYHAQTDFYGLFQARAIMHIFRDPKTP